MTALQIANRSGAMAPVPPRCVDSDATAGTRGSVDPRTHAAGAADRAAHPGTPAAAYQPGRPDLDRCVGPDCGDRSFRPAAQSQTENLRRVQDPRRHPGQPAGNGLGAAAEAPKSPADRDCRGGGGTTPAARAHRGGDGGRIACFNRTVPRMAAGSARHEPGADCGMPAARRPAASSISCRTRKRTNPRAWWSGPSCACCWRR